MILSIWYFALAFHCRSTKRIEEEEEEEEAVDKSVSQRVVVNVVLADFLAWCVLVIGGERLFPQNFSLLNLIFFFFLQDIYFYTVHRLLHAFAFSRIHSIHHSVYSPFHAWNSHIIEHLLLNMGCFAVPYALCPNPSWVFVLLAFAQVFSSVTGHADCTPHEGHHKNPKTKLGSIYLVDWVVAKFEQ